MDANESQLGLRRSWFPDNAATRIMGAHAAALRQADRQASTPKALGYFAHLHHGISSSEGGCFGDEKETIF
jgi:hypothetical protein